MQIMDMKVFTGTANQALANRIAKCLNVQLGAVEITRFPEGEIHVKYLENVRGQDVFIVQPICRPPNEMLMELLIMVDAASRASAARITVVIPFFGYARQDRKDQPRVPITAKLVANLLVAAGADRIMGMDFHSQQIQGFFDIPVDHLYAMPVMVRALKQKGLKDVVVVSPDSGGVKMAISYAQSLGAGFALGAKYRRSPREVDAMNVVGEVEGRTCVMVDDIISTGSTFCEAARQLKKHGAADIYGVVSHVMLREEGIAKLKASPIKELIVTDSIPLAIETDYPITVLTIAELLGEAILRVHENRSVSSLFRL
jgi:ribose-phosphate pyrophosphokinase